jgi:hypothetical protein
MPSMRVIVGGAIGCLFICGLFGGQAAAQTASTEPVGKPIQLLQLTHPGKPEAKPHERSAAKHTSKSHLAAKKSASPKLDFGQFRQRAGERILQGKLIRRGILLLSRLGRDIKEIDTPRILPFEPSLTR